MDVGKALEKTIGRKWGCYHTFALLLITMPLLFHALFSMAHEVATTYPNHRCLVPECETPASTDMKPAWLQGDWVPACHRFIPVARAETTASTAPGREPATYLGTCTVAFSNVTEKCTQFVYPNRDLSIVTEWDLTCSNVWRLKLVRTLNFYGLIIGCLLSGWFSDQFGRRTLVLSGLGAAGVVGLIMSFSPNYDIFAVLAFFNPLFYGGVKDAAFIMGIELLPAWMRGGWGAYSGVITRIGFTLVFSLIAQADLQGIPESWRYWRWLLRVIYLVPLASLSSLWLMPESLHWLVAHGRSAEACDVIRKAAHTDRRASAGLELEKLEQTALRARAEGASVPPNRAFFGELWKVLCTRILVQTLILCSICWIFTSFLDLGLDLYFHYDRSSYYRHLVLVEIPGALLAWAFMNKFGRRKTLCVSLVLTSTCCFTYYFLPEHHYSSPHWSHTLIATLARLSMAVSSTVTYVVTAEMFPTKVRHSLFALVLTPGHLAASMVAQMGLDNPMLVLGAVALANCLLAIGLPETRNTSLPETAEDAAALGTDQANVAVAKQGVEA